MKYLVNRETKEHKVATPLAESIIKGYPYFKDDWQLVEADDKGWILFQGTDCPVPDKSRCDVILENGETQYLSNPGGCKWGGFDAIYEVCSYRPILAETAEKEELPQSIKSAAEQISRLQDAAFEQWLEERTDAVINAEEQQYAEPTRAEYLFDRLKSAIAASESIPGIIAEIDAMLPDGYCVFRCGSQPAKEADNANN